MTLITEQEALIERLDNPDADPAISAELHQDALIAVMNEPAGPLKRFRPGRSRSGPVGDMPPAGVGA